MGFYPPVLEIKARAIPYKSSISPAEDFFVIPFQMPTMNNIADLRKGHIQVAIKYQSTNAPAVNTVFSPDTHVIYIDAGKGMKADGSAG